MPQYMRDVHRQILRRKSALEKLGLTPYAILIPPRSYEALIGQMVTHSGEVVATPPVTYAGLLVVPQPYPGKLCVTVQPGEALSDRLIVRQVHDTIYEQEVKEARAWKARRAERRRKSGKLPAAHGKPDYSASQ